MKRFTAVLIALILLMSSSAFAQSDNWVELDLGAFTISIPEDMQGTISEDYLPDQPFAIFYTDYYSDELYKENVSFSYSNELLDIHALDPMKYADEAANETFKQFDEMGIPALFGFADDASIEMQDGREALFISYHTALMYGFEQFYRLRVFQMIIPHPATGTTFVVSVCTNDNDISETLISIADSLRWKY